VLFITIKEIVEKLSKYPEDMKCGTILTDEDGDVGDPMSIMIILPAKEGVNETT
jgi:hypothetical protein